MHRQSVERNKETKMNYKKCKYCKKNTAENKNQLNRSFENKNESTNYKVSQILM